MGRAEMNVFDRFTDGCFQATTRGSSFTLKVSFSVFYSESLFQEIRDGSFSSLIGSCRFAGSWVERFCVCGLAVLETETGHAVDALDQLAPVDHPDVVHLHGGDQVGILHELVLGRTHADFEVNVVCVRVFLVERSHEIVDPPVIVVDVDVDLESGKNLCSSRLKTCPRHSVSFCGLPTKSVNEHLLYSNAPPPLCQ